MSTAGERGPRLKQKDTAFPGASEEVGVSISHTHLVSIHNRPTMHLDVLPHVLCGCNFNQHQSSPTSRSSSNNEHG